MDVDVNVDGEEGSPSPHRSSLHHNNTKHHHHQSSHRDAPVRLPPVPRRADQLMEKVVNKNLVERHWVSTLTPMDTFSPVIPARRSDFEDPSLADPHLQVYWERQRTTAAAAKYKRKTQQRTAKGGALNRRFHEARRAATEQSSASRQRHDDGDEQRRHTSEHHHSRSSDSNRSSSSSSGSDRNDITASGPRRRCPIPLNDKPLEESELYCLRNLLCPMGGLQSSITLENIDLRWLRERIEDPNCFLQQSGGKKHQLKKSPERERKGVPPLPLLTLRNFDVDALGEDSFHHTSHISFKTSLINSPRSALVMLRNGVRMYVLLRRPASYYVAPSETISDMNLQLRFDLAENERIMLLESLRSQYDQLCGLVPFDRVSELLCVRQEVDYDAAQRIADERTQRDLEKLQHHEAREQRFGDLQIEREEVATQRLMALEEKLQHQQENKKRLMKERGEFLREKAKTKMAVIAQVREENEKATKEMAEAMASHRQHKLEAIQDMKQERAQEMHERAEHDAQRILESRKRITEQEEDDALRMRAYAEHKLQRAEAFMQRKAAEHDALRKRAGDADARRHHVKEKAAYEMEVLRLKIGEKLDHAAHRFDMFVSDKVEQRKALRVMHHVREIKSKQVLEQAVHAERQMVEDIIAVSKAAESKLKARRHRQAKEQRRAAEAHQFDIAQRQRVVAAKVQQSEFEKLLQLARMQQTEELLQAHRAVQEEAVKLTREGDKKVQLRRQQSKAMLEARAIDQAKALFQRTVSLKKDAAGSSVGRSASTRATSAEHVAGPLGEDGSQQRRSSSYFRDVGSRVSSEENSVASNTPVMMPLRSKSAEPHQQPQGGSSAMEHHGADAGRKRREQRLQNEAAAAAGNKRPPLPAGHKKSAAAAAPAAQAKAKSAKQPLLAEIPTTLLAVTEDTEELLTASVAGASSSEQASQHPSTGTATASLPPDVAPASVTPPPPPRQSDDAAQPPDDSPTHHDNSSFVSSHGGGATSPSSATSKSFEGTQTSMTSLMQGGDGNEGVEQGEPITLSTLEGQEEPTTIASHQPPQDSISVGSSPPPTIVEYAKRPSSRVSIILDAVDAPGSFDASSPVRSQASSINSNDRPQRASSRRKPGASSGSSVVEHSPTRDVGDSQKQPSVEVGGGSTGEERSDSEPASDYYSDSFASEGEASNGR